MVRRVIHAPISGVSTHFGWEKHRPLGLTGRVRTSTTFPRHFYKAFGATVLCAIVLFISCRPIAAQTFAERLNPTGDPIGGGPGYKGAWRASEGYSGKGIYTEADADFIVTTEADLRRVALSYYNRETGAKESGSSPAQSGDVVFIRGDASRELVIDKTLEFDFNAGVTVASDLGYDNGDGTYRWGTTIKIANPVMGMNPGFMTRGLFAPSNAWRLTGLILEGTSVWGQISNVAFSGHWQGGSLAIRVATDYGEEFEADNVWIFGFPYTAIMMYKGPALAHHLRIAWSRWEGFGYGLWPGRDPGPGDGKSYQQKLIGWLIEEVRHSTDYIEVGVKDNGDGTFTSGHELELIVKHGILAGASRSARLNVHGRQHYGEYSYIAEIGERTVDSDKLLMNMTFPSNAPGGGLDIRHIYALHPAPLTYMKWGSVTAADLQANPSLVPSNSGPVKIDFNTIFSSGSRQVVPEVTAQLSQTTVRSGQTVDLELSAFDPDGHSIRYYEVRWGDREDVREGQEFYFPGARPQRTFDKPGVYQINVLAYNELGIRGRKILTLTVNPPWSTPLLTYGRAPELPPGTREDWSNYYEVRLLLNGKEVGSYDWGAPANRGWQWQAVDISDILEKHNTLQFTLEVETKRNISDPDRSEPGRAVGYFKNLWIHNVPGIEAAGAWVSAADPLFTTPRGYGVEQDWRAAGSLARIKHFDTPSDVGRALYLGHRGVAKGSVTTWESPVFNYLHKPRNLTFQRSNADVVLSWDKQKLSDRVNVRFYRVNGGALVHEASGLLDEGRYTWSNGNNEESGDLRVEVEAVAARWDNPSIDVVSRPSTYSEGPVTAARQTIELKEGWNLVSSYVASEDLNLSSVLEPVLANVVVVEDQAGRVFDTRDGTDEIGTWDPLQSYMIYMSAADTLTITGSSLSQSSPTVPLREGWNYVPYLVEGALPVSEALHSISEHLVLVKDDTGAVYYPDLEIDAIGLMSPGRGYEVYLSGADELKYP